MSVEARNRYYRTLARLSTVLVFVLVAQCAKGQAGRAWSWGRGERGQLGHGVNTDRHAPLAITALPYVRAVAVGASHTLFLLYDGTVRACGYNLWGEVGDGTNAWKLEPVPVLGMTDVVGVAAGFHHSLALRADGTVWAWGNNEVGQLGDGTMVWRNTPTQVSGLAGIVQVAAGYDHSLALRSNGTVWAWGSNSDGQLGDGTHLSRLTPVPVYGLNGVGYIAAGGDFSLAIKNGGAVSWGSNMWGALGDGTTTTRAIPGWVDLAADVVAVAGGGFHALALASDGHVWAWGMNAFGQLGDGTTSASYVPIQVPRLSSIKEIATGRRHSAAMTNDGTVWMWGKNEFGQIGDGTTTNRVSAVQPLALPRCLHLATGPGADHSVVIQRAVSTLYMPAVSGTIGEPVLLRGYLKRASDNAWLVGRAIAFWVDGTLVGRAITDQNGRAQLLWVIAEGRADRALEGVFDGEEAYEEASAAAHLTAQTWTTKMATFDRTARITDRTELKCRLLRSDNAPIYNRGINFYVDGTFVVTRNTDLGGYARWPVYTVPDGAGAGTRTILSEWVGDAGYAAISKTANLTVLKAIPYIWVLNKSVPLGGIANLYAYFRRLYDYQKQVGKSVDFKIDGTWVQTVTTDAVGVARYLYRTAELVGAHTITCEFAGDAWLDPGSGSGTLTIY